MSAGLAQNPIGEVVDLFCGVGALSHGLKQAGFEIMAGYDTDKRCKYAFETNNAATFFPRDVSELTAQEIRAHFSGSRLAILAGCAPCQPFSSYRRRYEPDSRSGLIDIYARVAIEAAPDVVVMENVPALERFNGGRVFDRLVSTLDRGGYAIEWSVVKCEEFGVPQRRRRLILIAARGCKAIRLVASGSAAPMSVMAAIGGLPQLAAGQSDPDDELHVARPLSDLNLKRIRASRPGGTWRDWPEELRVACHRKPSGRGYSGVYARMAWNEPSPTITTQCYGFGNGRFGHPEQDRAISLREAAILQSFPRNYQFRPNSEKPSFNEIGRWIGNAVPIRLSREIGRQISQCGTSDGQPVKIEDPEVAS